MTIHKHTFLVTVLSEDTLDGEAIDELVDHLMQVDTLNIDITSGVKHLSSEALTDQDKLKAAYQEVPGAEEFFKIVGEGLVKP